MKTISILAITSLLAVASCAVHHSTLHKRSDWKAFEDGKLEVLPVVKVEVGERKLAFNNKALIHAAGGYVATLIADDPSVVKIELDVEERKTYLTGLRPGKTRMYVVNGFVYYQSLNTPAAKQQRPPSDTDPSYVLQVSE